MKLASLKEGQFVETGGYYTKGDAGQAKYLIVAAQAADGYGDHTLANGTVAVLQIIGGIVSASSLGAVSGSDQSLAIQHGINLTASLGLTLVGKEKLKAKDLLLPDSASIDLLLEPANNTAPVLILNGENVELNSTRIESPSTYTGTMFVVDDTYAGVTVTNFQRLRANHISFDGSSGTSRAMDVNLTLNTACAFWDIKSFVATNLGSGLVVLCEDAVNVPYFTSNIFSYFEIQNFIDKPLVLEAIGSGQCSNNQFNMTIQPASSRTVNGIKVRGWSKTVGNILNGEVWDWGDIYPTYKTASIEDFGNSTQINSVNEKYVSANNTTICTYQGFQKTNNYDLMIPSGDRDQSVYGNQDNIVVAADVRADMTVTLSDALDFSDTERLFSLNTFQDVRWNVVDQTTTRVLTVEFPSTNIHHASITTSNNGLATNVICELEESGVWTERSNTENNYDNIKGWRGSSLTGSGVTCTGVRFTMKAPKTIAATTGVVADASYISLSNVFVASNQDLLHTAYATTNDPLLLGKVKIEKVAVVDMTSYPQSKRITLYDESGVAVYVKGYDFP